MLFVQIIDHKVEELGYFPSVAEAHEVYGEQAEIIEFDSYRELEQFKKIQNHLRMAHIAFSDLAD